MNKYIKILFVVVAVLIYSCDKYPIEVQKNTDLSWDIDKEIQDDDIRNRIGFDPRKTYLYISDNEFHYPVFTLGSFFSYEKPHKLKIALTNPIDKEMRVTLGYDKTVFDMTKYEGFSLAEEDVLHLSRKEVVFAPGEKEKEIEFQLTDKIYQNTEIVVPFSLKKESEESVDFFTKEMGNFFVVVDRKSLLNIQKWVFKPLESSPHFIQIFNDIKQKNTDVWSEVLSSDIAIGKLSGGIGLEFNSDNYLSHYYLDFINEGGKVSINSVKQGNKTGGAWPYYEYLLPMPESLKVNSPYNIEKLSDTKFKFVSVANSEIWFIITK